MEKEFIPYDLSLRMKQLGFDEPCLAGWSHPFEHNPEGYLNLDQEGEHDFEAPLYQQAFRWFREEYGMLGCIEFTEPEYGGDYGYKLYYKPGHLYIDHWNKGFKTYEEAELACLEKLIEIVEEKPKQR